MSNRLFHHPRRIALILALGIALVLVVIGLPAQAQSGSIRYSAAWAWGSAIDTPGPGWEVTTDLGYRVQVETGALVFYSTELLACEHEHTQMLWQRLGDLLGELIGPATAYAGHGDEDSPAEVMPILVESLAEPATTELGTVQVSEPAYCQGHYLVARATDGEMAGRSLTVAGTITGPDGESRPFAIDTSLAWGTIADLQLPYATDVDGSAAIHGDIGDETLEIVVVRGLDTLFDGVDFAGIDATEQAKMILRNLTNHTALMIVGGAAH